jgi:hypothetical protein
MNWFSKHTAILLTVAMLATGCGALKLIPGLYSGPTEKNTKRMDAKQLKVTKEQQALEQLRDELEAKTAILVSNKVAQGSVFVQGTGRALDHVTNKEPAVVLAKDLNTMAAQALPKPPTADVEKMNKAVDNSLSTNATDQAKGETAINKFEDRLASTEKSMQKLESKYDGKIKDATEDLQKATEKMNKVADGMAQKANEYDEANSMWGSAKLFVKNCWKFIGFIVVLVILWFVAKIALSIYFPPAGVAMNGAEKVAGKVWARGFTEIVHGGEKFKDALSEKMPAILEAYKKGEASASDAVTKVIQEFHDSHQKAQSADTQNIIEKLTTTPIETVKPAA